MDIAAKTKPLDIHTVISNHLCFTVLHQCGRRVRDHLGDEVPPKVQRQRAPGHLQGGEHRHQGQRNRGQVQDGSTL